MTIITTSRSTSRASLDLLLRYPESAAGTPMWWAFLARNLDVLAEELALGDIEGLAAQVTRDTPELAADAIRLMHLDDSLRTQVRDLRLLVALRAGSDSAVAEVCGAMDALLRGISTLDRLSDELLLDAYERDFGGE